MKSSIRYITSFGFTITILLVLVFGCVSKEESNELTKDWKTEETSDYRIQFPEEYTLDKSEQMGTKFILFSELKNDEDKFKENINLMVQDLKGMNLNLDKFSEISINQIKTMITNSNIEYSTKEKNKDGDFFHIIYTGSQGIFNLKFEQYYFMKNEKAFFITFTSEISEYENYSSTAKMILNTFKLKWRYINSKNLTTASTWLAYVMNLAFPAYAGQDSRHLTARRLSQCWADAFGARG